MGRKRLRKDPGLVIKWVVALIAAAAVAVWLGLSLGKWLTPSQTTENASPGIDVSYHQGNIDWQAVADSGVEFAIIRLGYRGYDDGALHIDPNAAVNLTEARAAGLKLGAYFFSQAVTEEEAREEAALALQVLDGMELELPIAYDWEYVDPDKRTGDMTPKMLTACVRAFCGEIEAAGYESMIYFNQDLSRKLLEEEELEQYPFWLAMYDEELRFSYPVTFWQYSDEGTVPGITEKVDLNWYFP